LGILRLMRGRSKFEKNASDLQKPTRDNFTNTRDFLPKLPEVGKGRTRPKSKTRAKTLYRGVARVPSRVAQLNESLEKTLKG